MEYVISFAIGLVAMLYAVIIAGCLRETEW
jgi:hypothetical protein